MATVSFAGVAGAAAAGRGFGLKRQGSMKSSARTFVVAVDGSAVSERGLKIALATASPSTFDTIKLITVDTGKSDHDSKKTLDECENALKRMGIGQKIKLVDKKVYPLNGSVANTIVEAMKSENRAVLVVGAAGKTAQSASAKSSKAAKGQMPFGSNALEVQKACPHPVLFVKQKGFEDIVETEELMQKRARAEKPSKTTTFVACIDGTPVSQKCLDMGKREYPLNLHTRLRSHQRAFAAASPVSPPATLAETSLHAHPHACRAAYHLVRPHDKVIALYITSDEKAKNEAASMQGKSTCDKFGAMKPSSTFEYKQLSPVRGQSVAQQVSTFCDEDEVIADMVIMGSMELARNKPDSLGSVTASTSKMIPCPIFILKPDNY